MSRAAIQRASRGVLVEIEKQDKIEASYSAHLQYKPTPLSLHTPQQIIYQHPARHKIAITGRRFGKTVLQLYDGLKAVAKTVPYDPSSTAVVLLSEPTMGMARRLLFMPLVRILAGHKLVQSINKSSMTIDFKRGANGEYYPSIVILGLNDGDGNRARGMKIFHYGGDEIQDQRPKIFEEIILPAMTDVPGSTSLSTGTPKGKANHAFKRFTKALVDPEWAAFKFKSVHNPYINPMEIERLRNVLPPNIFAQEMEADFVNFEGQIFEYYNEIFIVDYIVPKAYCVMGVDWGDIHPACVVLLRSPKGYYQVVDSWTNRYNTTVVGDVFYTECARLAKKWGVTHAYCDPSRPAARDELKAYAGMHMLEDGFNPNSQGIAIVNSVMYQNRFLMHSACDPVGGTNDSGLELQTIPTIFDEIQGYHRAIHKSTGLVLEQEAPNQFCHRVDCLRYAIATMEIEIFKHQPTIQIAPINFSIPNWIVN